MEADYGIDRPKKANTEGGYGEVHRLGRAGGFEVYRPGYGR